MDGGTQTRAGFVRGAALTNKAPPQRPPWTNETALRERCTSCGDCLAACPEAILIPGPAGTPVLNFALGGCTFCGKCVEACDEGVFRSLDTSPWDLTAQIGPGCLLAAGISCQTCTDACDEGALRFEYRGGPAGAIRLDVDACTGCGACLPPCPANAVTITEKTKRAA